MHKAIVCKIVVTPHPDKDVHSLAVGTVCNETVIVSKETQSGEIGIYFPCELQLSEKFAVANNLLRKKDPVTGKNIGGLFEEKRRVRIQKIRNVRSYGFWAPLSYLAKLGGDISTLKEGDQIDTWNGISICNKYITRKIQQAGTNKSKTKKVEKYEYVFPEHRDTEQFRYHTHNFNAGDKVVVTLKLHGCVHKDTIVKTLEDGDLTIKQVVDEKKPRHILSHNTNTNEDIYVPIDEFYLEENSGEWFEIELEDGRKLVITGNNPVWLTKERCYRRVDELVIGDDLKI